MELSFENGKFINGFNENVQVENEILYPLVKSSMFKRAVIKDFSKYVIVTQKKLKEDTNYISFSMPKAWEYLYKNIELFRNRKSLIYKNAPDFSMFGVGDYSYSLFKVGVSGFYKTPLFSLLYTTNKKPVMVDDTSYFICFDNYNDAYVAMLYLNSSPLQDFLTGIAFLECFTS
ncbi:MAG: hypothetical protein ACOX3T_06600 [Bdellovibrionota bacterium]